MSKQQENPTAISERQPLPKVTIGAVGVTIQSDIGGATMAFEQLFDATIDAGDFDQQLDFLTARIGRARARVQLGEKLLAREIAQDMLDNWQRDRETALKAKGDERVRLLASFRATHEAFNKRGEFKPNANQTQAIQNLDQNIETTKTQFDERKQKLEQDVRLVDKQIARLRALIAGRDPVDEPEAEVVPLAEAAE